MALSRSSSQTFSGMMSISRGAAQSVESAMAAGKSGVGPTHEVTKTEAGRGEDRSKGVLAKNPNLFDNQSSGRLEVVETVGTLHRQLHSRYSNCTKS